MSFFQPEKRLVALRSLFSGVKRNKKSVGRIFINESLVIGKQEVFPGHVFNIPTGSDISGCMHPWFMGYEALVPASSIYTAKKGRLVSGREELFSFEYSVFDELTSQVQNPGAHLSKADFGKELRVRGSVLSLSLGGLESNYYHFLVEFLARYWIFRCSGIEVDWFVVPDHLSFQKEFLAILGINEKKIIRWGEHTSLVADTIVYPGLINNYMRVFQSDGLVNFRKKWLPSWLIDLYAWLKSQAVQRIDFPFVHKRIYVSRQSASNRRVVNEEKLLAALRAYGFLLLDCAEMSVSDQIAAFSGADMVIAPHGAGLANLLFGEPGTAVLELFPDLEYQDPSHWLTCNLIGHKYSYLIGDPVASSAKNPKDRDFAIEVDEVIKWVCSQS